MLDDAPESSVTRPHTHASASKAALRYLKTSGCSAISISADDQGAQIKTGFDQNAAVVFWLPVGSARAVAARARHRVAGADLDAAEAALQEAAAACKVRLTDHDIAVSRAEQAAGKLKQRTVALKGSPMLSAFNREYARRRQVAAAAGHGFMSYNNALRRLQEALIPSLVNGGQLVADQSLFSQVFNTK